MYILLAVHYSILKRLYRKRHKDLKFAIDSLALICIFLLTFFIWTLIIDPVTIWNHPGNRNPIKSRIDLMVLLGVILIMSFLVDKFVEDKIHKLRRAIDITSRVTRSFSFIYLSIFLVLFVLSFINIIDAKP